MHVCIKQRHVHAHKPRQVESQCSLTSAVREAIVSRSTPGALSTDDVLSTGTLSSDWITVGCRGASLVTVARQSAIIVGCYKRAGRVSAELGRGSGAAETEQRESNSFKYSRDLVLDYHS